ncbi:MAG: hypothetical protein JXB29_04500 [Sedimentisphaerales bacterium]|nr:hypothetical protein [Sedimentisphaerales bacterium]
MDIKNREIIVMPKEGWYTAIAILMIFTVCVISDADNENDVNETKADTLLFSIAPVEVNMPPIKVLPVKVNVPPVELPPVEVQMPNGKSLCAIIIAAFAAVMAWRAARNTRLVAEGELFSKLIEEYSSSEMHKDLDKIFDWYSKNKFDINEEEISEKDTEDIFKAARNGIKCKQINKARRHVTHYFLKILDLEKSDYTMKKLVSRKKVFAKLVCEAVCTNVLYALFPLECAKIAVINKEDPEAKFNEIKEKFNKLLKLSNKKSLDEKFTNLNDAYKNLLAENNNSSAT